jgi:MEMO1 family protein
MLTKVRKAAVAGRFYPEKKEEILKLFRFLSLKEKEKVNFSLTENNIIAAILPHAAHIYSGYQNIHFFEILKNSGQIFDTFVIIHPIHHGGSTPFATDNNNYWETPLGRSALDAQLIELMGIDRLSNYMENEHSAEVILPFIQHFANSEFQILPIGMAQQSFQYSRQIAEKLQHAIIQSKKRVCILASSDFTHFESPEHGAMLDQFVIDKIMAHDPKGIEEEVKSKNLSVCGFGAIMALMEYIIALNKKVKTDILLRGHSGQVHSSAEVVDYVSILFSEEKCLK